MFGIFENYQNLYSWLPRMGKTTFDVSLAHFLLMFGYKLFSLYYPLFLISTGFSIMNIGSIYLLTYSVIAVGSVIINHYIRRFNPSKIAALGIAGYGIFALLMVVSHNLSVFYFAQIILGFSAAAWLTSFRLILMKSKTDNHSQSFGWFYSMPHYAAAIAPAIGGVVIWKFGFTGVFLLSVAIQFVNAFYVYARLNGNTTIIAKSPDTSGLPAMAGFKQSLKIIKSDKAFIFILSSLFSVLILGGIYRAFFVLFLENLSFSREEIIKFISLASIAYLPLSVIIIKIMGKLKSGKIISGGIAAEGFATIVLGIFANAMSLLGLFAVMIFDSLGALAAGSGKSALLSKKLENCREEASTIDTILTTLGPAFGGLLGGIAISCLGFQNTFLIAGGAVFLMGIMSWFCKLNKGMA